jgi:TonB-linked SusC/RagA family outer membrane protein
VVVGYGTQSRNALTGSVSTLNANAYKDQPVVNVSSALQGRVAGVSITNSSGAPGGDVKVRIRGSNSINGYNDPLIVVDGVALGSMGLPDLNVNDIESMDILKDASATAIYGSRGANGVVIITTRAGKAGLVQVEYNGFATYNKPMNQYKLLDAVAYAKLANYLEGTNVFPNPESFAGKSTDWQDQLFRTGKSQSHQLSIAGGTEKSRYYISGNYIDQSGIIINTSQKKFALRSNLDSKLSDRISIGLNVFASRTNSRNNRDIGGKGNPVMSALAWGPTEPVYDDPAQGIYNRLASATIWPNPYMIAKERLSEMFTDAAVINGKLKYNITEWLTLNTNFGIDKSISKTAFLNNTWVAPGNLGSGQAFYESLTWQNSNVVTAHKIFNGIHDVTVTGILEETSNKASSFNANGSGLLTTTNGYNNLALNQSQSIGSAYSNWALLSYVGRVSYALLNKYLFTATYRADGSSKFQHTNTKWGYFPSLGLGWRLSDESFIKNLNAFSNLKLRASWGITGSQAIPAYSTMSLLQPVYYSFGSSTLFPGYTLGNPANPNLTWEKTAQTDIGLDVALFNNRVRLVVDYYNKRTRDLLLYVPIAAYDGGGAKLQNLGKVENKGVEISLDVEVIRGKNFSWTTSLNGSTYRNKVLSLGKDSILYRPSIGSGLINTNIQVIKPGEPLGAFYLIPWTGVYQSNDNTLGFKAGDNRYIDVNQNGSIGYEDRKVVGDARPTFQWGFNNNLHFRDFELNVFMQGSHGNKIFNATYAAIAAPVSDVRYPTLAEASNYWSAHNTSSTTADPASKTNRNFVESTKYLQDGSYVRLKNVSLSYTVDKTILRFASLRLSASGQNLFTITKYKGYDPEASSTSGSASDADAGIDLGAYPSSRTLALAVALRF